MTEFVESSLVKDYGLDFDQLWLFKPRRSLNIAHQR